MFAAVQFESNPPVLKRMNLNSSWRFTVPSGKLNQKDVCSSLVKPLVRWMQFLFFWLFETQIDNTMSGQSCSSLLYFTLVTAQQTDLLQEIHQLACPCASPVPPPPPPPRRQTWPRSLSLPSQYPDTYLVTWSWRNDRCSSPSLNVQEKMCEKQI